MKVLVINCGSSSLKYQLINMANDDVLASGLAERIGIKDGFVTHKPSGKDKVIFNEDLKDHKMALQIVFEALVNTGYGVIKDLREIGAVGHRVVNGGEKHMETVVVDDNVLNDLKEAIPLAPLHSPGNIMGIEACMEMLPGIPMVTVFDTAFHKTMPREAYMYAIPYRYYEKYGIRKYGFHGTSHKFVSKKAADLMGENISNLKLITCHLGSGASISAVNQGKCIENSMGFTPLDGLVMGTRSGNIDPAIVKFIVENDGKTIEEVDTILNKESGVLGLSGVSSDFRDLDLAVEKGNDRAKLAIDVFLYRCKLIIGSYISAMQGVDGIIFTAGVGENSTGVREALVNHFSYLGMTLDKDANQFRGEEKVITTSDSKVTAMVIPTNEELMIAIETINALK